MSFSLIITFCFFILFPTGGDSQCRTGRTQTEGGRPAEGGGTIEGTAQQITSLLHNTCQQLPGNGTQVLFFLNVCLNFYASATASDFYILFLLQSLEVYLLINVESK